LAAYYSHLPWRCLFRVASLPAPLRRATPLRGLPSASWLRGAKRLTWRGRQVIATLRCAGHPILGYWAAFLAALFDKKELLAGSR
jgi:hypothetical protein